MKKFKTSDIGIAAFIMMKGLRLSNASRAQTGRFMFEFEDPNDLAKKYAVRYIS